MPDKRARYTGPSETGVTLSVPLSDGQTIYGVHIDKNAELPTEINGIKVPAAFRDSLLEQEDNWSEFNRATGSEATGSDTKAKTTAAKSGKDGE